MEGHVPGRETAKMEIDERSDAGPAPQDSYPGEERRIVFRDTRERGGGFERFLTLAF